MKRSICRGKSCWQENDHYVAHRFRGPFRLRFALSRKILIKTTTNLKNERENSETQWTARSTPSNIKFLVQILDIVFYYFSSGRRDYLRGVKSLSGCSSMRHVNMDIQGSSDGNSSRRTVVVAAVSELGKAWFVLACFGWFIIGFVAGIIITRVEAGLAFRTLLVAAILEIGLGYSRFEALLGYISFFAIASHVYSSTELDFRNARSGSRHVRQAHDRRGGHSSHANDRCGGDSSHANDNGGLDAHLCCRLGRVCVLRGVWQNEEWKKWAQQCWRVGCATCAVDINIVMLLGFNTHVAL